MKLNPANIRNRAITAAAILFVFFAQCRALAWTEQTHAMIAEKEVKLMPGEIQGAVKKNYAAYMAGVREEGELYDRVLSETDSAGASFIQQRGMERYFMLLKRLNYALDRRSDQKTIAYEAGRVTRAGADLLEPLPADGGYRTMELSGYRMYFLDDMQNTHDSFKYVYGARRTITSYPQRLSEELDIASRKGATIYNSYRKGSSFYVVEDDAHVSANRALNFIADSLYTQLLNRDGAKKDPFDPALYLQLDRFRRGEKSGYMEGPKVEAPAKPKAPTVKAPETEAPALKPKSEKPAAEKTAPEKTEKTEKKKTTATTAKSGGKKNADKTKKQK